MAKFTYEIKIPNSGTYEVESDRELTDAQAYQYALQQAGTEPATTKDQPAGYNPIATANSFFPSLYQNTVGGLVNLVSSPVQSAQALGDIVAGGVYNAMPAPVQRGLTAIEQSEYNPLGDPAAQQRAIQTANLVGQDYATTYGTGAGFQKMMEEDPFRIAGDVSMLLGGGGAALRAGTTGTRSTIVADALTRGGELTNPMNLIAKPAAAMIRQPNVDPNVKMLMDEGITPTPGQILGGAFKRAEEGLSSVPILGDFIKSAQIRAVEGLNRAAINRALKPIGDTLPADLKGRDAIKYAENALGDKYENLLPQMTVVKDALFQTEIFNLKNMVDNGAINQTSKDFFNKWLNNNVLGKFQGQGAITGDTLKGIQSDLRTTINDLSASTNYDERLIGTALKEAQDQLRQLVTRTNPKFSKELKAIDTGYANFKRVEKAAGLVGAEGGVFSPAQLQSAIRASDKSKDKGKFATGDAFMQDLSEAGKTVLGNKVPDSGTPYRGMLPLFLGGSAGVAGYPAITAGLLTGPMLYSAPGQKLTATLLTKRPAGANALADQFRGNERAKLAALMAAQAGNRIPREDGLLSGQIR
jgi:hypothetical protein